MGIIFRQYVNPIHLRFPPPDDKPEWPAYDVDLYDVKEAQPMPDPLDDDPE